MGALVGFDRVEFDEETGRCMQRLFCAIDYEEE
jgi:hypothetical protein